MSSINLTWGIASGFDDSEIRGVLAKSDFDFEESNTPHEIWRAKGDGINVVRYAKKLFVQGRENDENLQLIQELSMVNGLNFVDRANMKKFIELFKSQHNAIVCTCGNTSLLIEGKIEGLDIIFHNECEHTNSLKPPLLTANCRILPDINALIGGHLSRCINLGYFEGFEVVIPDFIMKALDYLGSQRKSGASNEISKLREDETKGRVSIFNYNDGVPLPSKEKFDTEEDDIIIRIANQTNSILLTGDGNLKDKAILKNRPTIYIHPQEGKPIKIIEHVRSP